MSVKLSQKLVSKPTKVIQTRLDADLVDKANKILEEIGLSTSDIFRILLKKVVNTGEVPLSLSVSNKQFTTEFYSKIDKALDEVKSPEKLLKIGKKQSIESTFKDI